MLQNEFALLWMQIFYTAKLHFCKNLICRLSAHVLIAQSFLSNDVCRNCLKVDMPTSQTCLKQKFESGKGCAFFMIAKYYLLFIL